MRIEKKEAKEKLTRATSNSARQTPKSEAPTPMEESQKVVEKIAPLRTIEPAGINAVAEDGWVEIEVAVDSGATETVMPEETLNEIIGITESAACKRGVVYEVADGTQIPNVGERNFPGVMDDGSAKKVTAQICTINKMLMSVS